MATATEPVDTGVETDEERIARELEEQAERMGSDPDPEPGEGAGEPESDEVDDAIAAEFDDDEPAEPDEVAVTGNVDLDYFKAGGKAPQTATLTLAGLSGMKIMDRKGYKKGSFVGFRGVARIEAVTQKDKMDRTANQAVDCVQAHVAYATDVQILPASTATLPEGTPEEILGIISEIAGRDDADELQQLRDIRAVLTEL